MLCDLFEVHLSHFICNSTFSNSPNTSYNVRFNIKSLVYCHLVIIMTFMIAKGDLFKNDDPLYFTYDWIQPDKR
jgi:hypothetical protein